MCSRDDANIKHNDAIERRHRHTTIKTSPQRYAVNEEGRGELPQHNNIIRVSERCTHVSIHHKARQVVE